MYVPLGFKGLNEEREMTKMLTQCGAYGNRRCIFQLSPVFHSVTVVIPFPIQMLYRCLYFLIIRTQVSSAWVGLSRL
jgi:hypothetical protein